MDVTSEVILPYDRSIVPQQTGYWCGPGSAQVVLSGRGIAIAESDLADEAGTTTDGTSCIQAIERVLNRHLPDARYTSVVMQQDPPTQSETDALFNHVRSSIDAGYGVVMNWVAPPGNYPRGVKGSVSPGYGGGTIWHYVSCMGYDAAGQAFWIADSGFRPQGYWVSVRQVATLIPPKGYCYSTAQPTRPQPTGDTVSNTPAISKPADEAGQTSDVWSQVLTRWDMLGGHTIVEAVALIGAKLEITGFNPPSH